MTSLINWFSMHGYGGYVWSAYGVVLGAFALNLVIIRRNQHKVRKNLLKWYSRHS